MMGPTPWKLPSVGGFPVGFPSKLNKCEEAFAYAQAENAESNHPIKTPLSYTYEYGFGKGPPCFLGQELRAVK